MRSKLLALLPALILAAGLAGCGSDGTTVGGGSDVPQTGAGTRQATAFDPRDEPLTCITGKGVEAVKDDRYRDKIRILPATSGAYIVFAATPAEAQGRAIKDTDDAAGAEVIGPALFTVGDLPDDTLEKIEECLTEQGVRYG